MVSSTLVPSGAIEVCDLTRLAALRWRCAMSDHPAAQSPQAGHRARSPAGDRPIWFRDAGEAARRRVGEPAGTGRQGFGPEPACVVVLVARHPPKSVLLLQKRRPGAPQRRPPPTHRRRSGGDVALRVELEAPQRIRTEADVTGLPIASRSVIEVVPVSSLTATEKPSSTVISLRPVAGVDTAVGSGLSPAYSNCASPAPATEVTRPSSSYSNDDDNPSTASSITRPSSSYDWASGDMTSPLGSVYSADRSVSRHHRTVEQVRPRRLAPLAVRRSASSCS